MPGGSWVRSAEDPRVEGDRLFARLKDREGNWKHAVAKFAPGERFCRPGTRNSGSTTTRSSLRLGVQSSCTSYTYAGFAFWGSSCIWPQILP